MNEITMVPWRWGNPVERMVHYLVYDKIEGWTVSMYLEGVGWFVHNKMPRLNPSDEDLLHSVTHRSSEKLSRLGPTS